MHGDAPAIAVSSKLSWLSDPELHSPTSFRETMGEWLESDARIFTVLDNLI